MVVYRHSFSRLFLTRYETHLTVFLAVRKTYEYKKDNIINYLGINNGGEWGIRTLGTLRYTHFPGVLLKPLRQLSGFRIFNCSLMWALSKSLPVFWLLFTVFNSGRRLQDTNFSINLYVLLTRIKQLIKLITNVFRESSANFDNMVSFLIVV